MTMQNTPLLMSRILGRGAELDPEVEVVTAQASGTHRQTLKQTWNRAQQVANALKSHGIETGDRIGSFMWNNYRHLELYQGVPSMGCVLHTLNIRLSPTDLEYIINHAGDRVIFADEDLLPLLEPLWGKIPCVELLVICRHGEGVESSFTNQVDYEDFIADHPAAYDWPDIPETAPMGLCYTSGTTGNPKGVMYTNRSTYLHTLTESLTDSMGLSALDSLLGIVPMFHAMGWGLPFAASMLGTKQVYPSIHDSGFFPQSDAAGTGHDLGGRTYDLAGGARHTDSQPGQVRSFETAAPHLWRLCPARRNDALVLGNLWCRNDSGLGHDRDQPSRHTVTESLKTVPDRIIRRSAV